MKKIIALVLVSLLVLAGCGSKGSETPKKETLTVKVDSNLKTKGQLGADYGMNWDEQVKAITDYAIGKDKAAVAEATKDADVSSSVSIYADHLSGLLSGTMDKVETVNANIAKIGTGIVNSVRNNEVTDKDGNFETNVTYATVAVDADGKIAFVTIDTAQNELTFSATEVKEFKARGTKKELGADYGMNWDEQIASLQDYLVGKSIADVTGESASSDLSSSVSINLDGYIEAVKLAIDNAVDVKDVASIGQGSSVSAKTDGAPTYEINTAVAAVALDSKGNAVYAFIDEAQLKANIE